MANIIDITPKLTNEAPKVKLWGKEFIADTRKNTVIELYTLLEKSSGSPADICDGIELILGKEAVDLINVENPYFSDLKTMFYCILAVSTDEPVEDVINRFREEEPTVK